MINDKIIKIASKTQNAGLKNVFTHKSFVKNSSCGDIIKVEFVVDNLKIKSMRYETESCVLCEASASLFSSKIKNYYVKDLKKDIDNIKKMKKNKKIIIPSKFKEFKILLNNKTLSRFNCVILPMEAFLKAFRLS
tara:strand:+ start:1243 stop:1647 length:405 start_codon:yes stop_codon:yes gene_type:complete